MVLETHVEDASEWRPPRRSVLNLSEFWLFRLSPRLLSPFHAFGQVVFADNSLSGFVIIASLFVDQPWLATMAILGCCSGELSAYAAGVDNTTVARGMCSYNGVLVGCGFAVFFGFPAWSWQCVAAIACGGVVQSYILVAISKTLNSPAWTWPFNIVVLCTLSYNPPFPPSSSLPKEWFLLDDYMADFDVLDIVKGILIGVSQIFVVENWISGLLILIGLSVHDVKLATSCLTGSVVGLIVGLIFQAESSDIKAGLWGFNPALTAAAVYTFCAPSRQMCVFLVISACVTQILAASMARIFSTVLQIPIGTVPFCMVATFAFKLIGHLQGITFRVAAPVKVESSQQIDGKDSIDGVDVVVGTPLCTPDKEFFC